MVITLMGTQLFQVRFAQALLDIIETQPARTGFIHLIIEIQDYQQFSSKLRSTYEGEVVPFDKIKLSSNLQ